MVRCSSMCSKAWVIVSVRSRRLRSRPWPLRTAATRLNARRRPIGCWKWHCGRRRNSQNGLRPARILQRRYLGRSKPCGQAPSPFRSHSASRILLELLTARSGARPRRDERSLLYAIPHERPRRQRLAQYQFADYREARVVSDSECTRLAPSTVVIAPRQLEAVGSHDGCNSCGDLLHRCVR